MTFLASQRIILSAILALALAGPAFGHAHLSKSVPASGATVSAPQEIVLTFTEPLEPSFSTVELSDEAGHSIKTDKAQIKDNVMRVPLRSLAAGRYTVKWHALSVDTHKSQGDFSFTVAH